MDRKRLPKLNKFEKEELRSFKDNVKRCLPSGKSKDQKFQHLFKANLILLANAPTPGQCTDSWPCPASRRVATCRPIAFCSWSTEPTSRKHSCNNIQIGRFTPANAQAMKFANYLHLQTEQLLKIFLGKTIDNY